MQLAAFLAVCSAALLLALAPARAQRVAAHLSADSVQVGERFALSLVADHNFMTQARFPAARSDSGTAGRFGDLVVLARRDSAQRYLRGQGGGGSGTQRDSVVYEVTTFALDTARVGAVPIAFVQGGDTVRTAATREQLLPVASVLPAGVRAGRDTAQLRPLAPPVPFPQPWWPWVLGAAGVLTLAGLLAYLWWQDRQAEGAAAAEAPAAPLVPPAEDARQRLHALEEETDLADPGVAKPFYTDLSGILRRYLMHRLGLRAFRRTTGELVEALRRQSAAGRLPEAVPQRARRALEGADLAKFADQRPAAEARRAALADARAVIDAVEAAQQPAPDDSETEAAEADEKPRPVPPEGQ